MSQQWKSRLIAAFAVLSAGRDESGGRRQMVACFYKHRTQFRRPRAASDQAVPSDNSPKQTQTARSRLSKTYRWEPAFFTLTSVFVRTGIIYDHVMSASPSTDNKYYTHQKKNFLWVATYYHAAIFAWNLGLFRYNEYIFQNIDNL